MVEFQPPRIIDNEAIWKPAEDARGLYERVNNRERELSELHDESRLRPGASTFGLGGRVVITVALILPMVFTWLIMASAWGPAWATCFTLGMGGFWVVTAKLILPDVWRKERTFSEPMPFGRSLQELRSSQRRDRDYRAGLVPGRYRCAGCGAGKRPGEQRCYRCGASGWIERAGPGGFFACATCDAPRELGEGREWCANCGAPESAAIFIQPSDSEARTSTAAAAHQAAAPVDPYRSFGTGSKIAWTGVIVVSGLVLVVFHGNEAAWGPPGYAVVALISLWAIWRR